MVPVHRTRMPRRASPVTESISPYRPPSEAISEVTRLKDRFYFDEDAQERRKKGKELIPTKPPMNGYAEPWFDYPIYRGAFENTRLHDFGPPNPSYPTARTYPFRRPDEYDSDHDWQPGAEPTRDITSQLDISIGPGIDGILTLDSGDLTVPLTMDLEEDLEEQLSEMSRLSRLGHFSAAIRFFDENLQHHVDDPYVFVQYADLLLQQGDFKAVAVLKDDAIHKHGQELSNSKELRILRVNWELLQILAKSRTLDILGNARAVFNEAIHVLTETAENYLSDRPISSTEIQILGLTIRLTRLQVLHSDWANYETRALGTLPIASLRFYQTLLRQGRVWDFHDILVLLPTIADIKTLTTAIFHEDLIPSLKKIISDWSDSVHGYDSSTTLALLGITTHILLEPVRASEKECIDILELSLPLAVSVLENDPSNVKSRPYLRFLLAKSRFAGTASRQAMLHLTNRLQSSQGLFYQPDVALLPIYVPAGDEIPEWTPIEQPSALKDPVKLVLSSVTELGDLRTEVLARQELIRLSVDLQEEFEKLCNLQLTRQGDLNGYSSTLPSRYLVSNTMLAKENLQTSILYLLHSKIASTDYLDPSHQWILRVLLYKLEGRPPSTIQHLLKRDRSNYQNISESLLREISKKMPILKDSVDQHPKNRVRSSFFQADAGPRRKERPATRRPFARRATGFDSRRMAAQQLHRRQRPVIAANPKEEQEIITDTEFNRRLRRPSNFPPPRLPLREGRRHTASNPMAENMIITDTESNERLKEPSNVPPPPPRRESKPKEDQEITTYSESSESISDDTPVSSPRPREHGHHTANELGKSREMPYNPAPNLDKPDRHVQLPNDKPSTANSRSPDDTILANQIRMEMSAFYDEKLKAEAASARKQQEEQMATLIEGLNKEVRAFKKEAAEQAQRKIQVEALAQAEQARWERQIEESNLQKEIAMKMETNRELIMKEVERMMADHTVRQMENEARHKAEAEVRKMMESESRADETKAIEKLKEELRLEAEAKERELRRKIEEEMRQKHEAEDEAGGEVRREEVRQWAAERVEQDRENENRIHLRDAVGRMFVIPYSQARIWQDMENLIRTAFRHVGNIESEVIAGHYDLVGPNGIILPQTWNDVIQPGWNIAMYMWPMTPSPDPTRSFPGPGSEVSELTSLYPHPGQHGDVDMEIEEPNDQAGTSDERIVDEVSSSYTSRSGPLKPSRRKRIAKAFSLFSTSRRRPQPISVSSRSSEVDE